MLHKPWAGESLAFLIKANGSINPFLYFPERKSTIVSFGTSLNGQKMQSDSFSGTQQQI